MPKRSRRPSQSRSRNRSQRRQRPSKPRSRSRVQRSRGTRYRGDGYEDTRAELVEYANAQGFDITHETCDEKQQSRVGEWRDIFKDYLQGEFGIVLPQVVVKKPDDYFRPAPLATEMMAAEKTVLAIQHYLHHVAGKSLPEVLKHLPPFHTMEFWKKFMILYLSQSVRTGGFACTNLLKGTSVFNTTFKEEKKLRPYDEPKFPFINEEVHGQRKKAIKSVDPATSHRKRALAAANDAVAAEVARELTGMEHDEVADTWPGLEDLLETEYVRQALEESEDQTGPDFELRVNPKFLFEPEDLSLDAADKTSPATQTGPDFKLHVNPKFLFGPLHY